MLSFSKIICYIDSVVKNNRREKLEMARKLTECSALILLFIPVFVAIASVIIKFNVVDFVYFVLVVAYLAPFFLH